MSSIEKNTLRYLQRYSEAPSFEELADWQYDYDHVLIIPAWRETPDFLQRLQSNLLKDARVLLILVINRPDNSPPDQENQLLCTYIRNSFPPLWHLPSHRCSLHPVEQSGLLLIDRESHPIPHKEGVGAARKLAADFATSLMALGRIASPWIHSTDADATLPANYLQATSELPSDAVAGCYRFSHTDSGDLVSRATAMYQRHMNVYRDGLRDAGSPYAFHTIGSTLVFRASAYVQARGFPRRAAGEDFYLLNKLAKLGKISELSPCITLTARASDRVPFGTGPSCRKIMQQLQDQVTVKTYNPEIFEHLRLWLHSATNAIRQETDVDWKAVLLSQHPSVKEALEESGFLRLTQHLQQSESIQWRINHFHHWFDGFRTLQFVHQLQRNGFEPVELSF